MAEIRATSIIAEAFAYTPNDPVVVVVTGTTTGQVAVMFSE